MRNILYFLIQASNASRQCVEIKNTICLLNPGIHSIISSRELLVRCVYESKENLYQEYFSFYVEIPSWAKD